MNDNADTLELRDVPIPEPLIPGYGLWVWWMAAGVVLIVAIMAWWLFRQLKRHAVDHVKIREQALKEAENAIAALKTNDPRDAAVQASLIVRKYLSLAARDPALFETHEEFIARHNSLAALGENARKAAGEGFAKLAALKYSPDQPSADASAVLTDTRQLLLTLHHGFAA